MTHTAGTNHYPNWNTHSHKTDDNLPRHFRDNNQHPVHLTIHVKKSHANAKMTMVNAVDISAQAVRRSQELPSHLIYLVPYPTYEYTGDDR